MLSSPTSGLSFFYCDAKGNPDLSCLRFFLIPLFFPSWGFLSVCFRRWWVSVLYATLTFSVSRYICLSCVMSGSHILSSLSFPFTSYFSLVSRQLEFQWNLLIVYFFFPYVFLPRFHKCQGKLFFIYYLISFTWNQLPVGSVKVVCRWVTFAKGECKHVTTEASYHLTISPTITSHLLNSSSYHVRTWTTLAEHLFNTSTTPPSQHQSPQFMIHHTWTNHNLTYTFSISNNLNV